MALAVRISEGHPEPQAPLEEERLASPPRDLAIDAGLERFARLANELSTPKVLRCPDDPNPPTAAAWLGFSTAPMSYFLGVESGHLQHSVWLAGDRHITLGGKVLPSGIHSLRADGQLGWSARIHKGQGNVALGDGSVQQVSGTRLSDMAGNAGNDGMRVWIP